MAVNKQGKLELMNAAGETINVDPKNKVLRDFVKNQGFLPAKEMRKEISRQEAIVAKTTKDTVTPPTVGNQYKPGYDIQDFDTISYNDYARMKENANKSTQGFLGNVFGKGQQLKDDVKYIEDNKMIRGEATAPVAAPEQKYPGIQVIDDGFGGTMAIKTDGIDRVNVNPSFSGGQTATPGQAAPVPKQTFKEYTDLNKIARNPDYPIGVEELPPSQGVPLHPVTGLPIEAGGDKWSSYTDAPEGRTYNNKNFNWNNSSPGQVASLSQQEIDGLYGRPISPVQPKQEVDFSGIANWFRKNGFK